MSTRRRALPLGLVVAASVTAGAAGQETKPAVNVADDLVAAEPGRLAFDGGASRAGFPAAQVV